MRPAGCTVGFGVGTTFRWESRLTLHAEADPAAVADFPDDFIDGVLTGLSSHDLAPPVDWRALPGRSFRKADHDDDDSIYVGVHEFAPRVELEFLDRDGPRFRLRAAWHLEENAEAGPDPVVAEGWFGFRGVTVRANDKIFGTRLRELTGRYGRDGVPDAAMADFDRDLIAAAGAVLERFAADRDAEYGPPQHTSWNVRKSGWHLVRFPPRSG